MTRREAREQAFILIFEKEFNSEYSIAQIIDAAEQAELFRADAFARQLSEKTFACLDKLDETIASALKTGWKITRISKVSLAILRLAVCEMLEFPDIPVSVSINEAVELAKKYAPEEDAGFVNGLLGSLSRGFVTNG